jgi:hypothetical protein
MLMAMGAIRPLTCGASVRKVPSWAFKITRPILHALRAISGHLRRNGFRAQSGHGPTVV